MATNILETRFSPEEINALKKRFAVLVAKYKSNRDEIFASDEFRMMLRNDTACMLYVNSNWYYDDTVIDILSTQDIDNRILSKADVLEKLLAIHDRTMDDTLKYKCLISYADIAGHSSKGKNSADTAQPVSNVILVTDNGTSQQWEDKLAKQQQELHERGKLLLGSGGINVN